MKHIKNILIKTILLINIIFLINLNANEYLQETPEIKFNPELIELVQKLDKDPLKIFNWVNNNIDFEDYHRARKDALSTYFTRRGNEWDQSTLLIALFRIAGIEARYLKYNYEEENKNESNDENNVLVEALLSIENYRGNGKNKKVWMPIAPWKKEYEMKIGMDLFPSGYIPEELDFDFDDYLSTNKQETTIELFEKDLQAYLNKYYKGKTLKDLGTTKTLKKRKLDILPLSIPTSISQDFNTTLSFAKIPNEHKYSVKYYLKKYPSKEMFFEHTFYFPEVASSRIVLECLTVGNKKKPVIKKDGVIIAQSTYFLSSNEKFIDGHKVLDLKAMDRIPKETSEITALGFDSVNVSNEYINKLKNELSNTSIDKINSENTREEYIGRYLSILNAQYRQRAYQGYQKIDKYLNVGRINRGYRMVRVYTDTSNINNFISNDEKYLLHSSVNIDAMFGGTSIYKSDSGRGFLWKGRFSRFGQFLTGYTLSYNEGLIFEDWQSTASANTIKALMIANESNIPVVKLTKDSLVNGRVPILDAQTYNKYTEGTIQGIIKALAEESNTKITMPVRLVNYSDMKLMGRIEIADNYNAYYFNGNNGGRSTSTTLDQAYKKVKVSNTNLNNTYNGNSDSGSSSSFSVAVNNDTSQSQRSSDGDPVDMFSGEFYQEEKKEDIALKSSGKNLLAIKREYKSQLNYNGVFGYGWSWNHMERLIVSSSSNIIYVNDKGVFAQITKENNTYTYPNGAKYTLSLVNNKYVIKFFDGKSFIFDSDGKLLEKIDSNFNKITFEYDSNDRISKIKDKTQILNLTYNSNDKVTQVVDNIGRVVTYTYNDDDLISFTNLGGDTTRYEYLKNQSNPQNNHNMSKYILPNGDFLEITYYKNDQVSHHKNQDGNTFNFSYSRFNRYSETWNEAGYYRKIYFNNQADVIRIDKKDSAIEYKKYDANHNMISHTDANGNTTSYTYDTNRNIISKKDALGQEYTYEYNSLNKLIKETDPKGNITSYTHDTRGNLLSKTDALLNTQSYEYDSYGNQIKVTDALNNSIRFTFDNDGKNLLSKTDKKGNTTSYTYDSVGNILSQTNAKGFIKSFEYDNNNRVIKETDTLDHQTLSQYNENGKLIKKILPNNAQINYTYHKAKDIVVGNLLKEEIDPLGNKISYKYDALGNKTEIKDKKGNITILRYDELNRIISKTNDNEDTIYYIYDGLGNLIKEWSYIKTAVSSYIVGTTYTYDKANKLMKKVLPSGLIINYEYDKSGNKIEEKYDIDNETVTTKYEYNELNKLVKIIKGFKSNDRARVTSFVYDSLQRKIEEINPNGVKTKYKYDKNSNLIEKTIHNITFRYEYDELNRLSKEYDGNGNAISYKYDANNKLISKTDQLENIYEYVYDKVGNKTEEKYPNNTSIKYEYNLLAKPTVKIDQQNNKTYYEYDKNSNLIATIDPKLNKTQYSYDNLNRKTTALNANLARKTYTYDSQNNIIAEVDENDNITEYDYDESKNIIEKREFIYDFLYITTKYDYDKLNRLKTITNPKGDKTQYQYNIFNEKVKTIDALGNESTTKYDNMGNKIFQTDEKGITTSFTYDEIGNIKTIHQDNVMTQFSYDNNKNLLSKTIEGIITSYTYDKLNRNISTKIDNKIISSQSYDPIGNIISKTDGNGNITTYEYNKNNKVISKTDAKNNTTKYIYDENSNLISTITAEDIIVINKYDKLNRLTSQSVDNTTKEIYYDKNSNIIKEVDFKGIVKSTKYDGLNRITSITKAQNTTNQTKVSYTYDDNSNIEQIINENGQTIKYQYDELNRKVTHIYPSGKYKTYEYDKNSNLIRTIKEDNTHIVNSYDSLNRLEQVKVDGRIEQEYSYDKLSRLIQTIDRNHGNKTNIVTYTYDNLNNIITSTQNGKVVNKTYDNNSNQINLKTDTFEIVNQYNNLNLLENIKVNTNQIATFTYDKDQRVSKISKANGIVLDIEFDKRSRESKRTYSNNTFTQNTKYDLNSNIIKEDITYQNQTIIKEYEYDSQDRLINDFANNHTYNYDKVGNQIFTNQNGIDEIREVNEDNQYTYITNTDIQYDDNGNIKTYKDKEFIYDFLNRLVELKQNNSTIATYTYDAQNRRVSKILPNENKTISYIYNNNQVIQEYENNTLTNSYIYASYIDDPIAYIYNNNTYYYVKDRQYSIRAITNSTGNIVESYSYNSFGIMTIKDENQNVILKSNVNNAITFTGRRYDSESNLYYYRNRMYSPELGRFISKDPKGYIDGMNLYAYVKNNPLKYLDAMGTRALNNFSGTVFENWQSDYKKETSSSSYLNSALEMIVPGQSAYNKAVDNFSKGNYGTAAVHGVAGFAEQVLTVVTAGASQAILTSTKAVVRASKSSKVVNNIAPAKRNTGITVLGHYPEYVELSEKLGARRFQLPDNIWNNMSDTKIWEANKKFLDRTITRGDSISLSNPSARPNSYFEKELDYLINKGYKFSEDGNSLIVPK